MKPLDRNLVLKYALIVAACELIPIPVFDGWAQTRMLRGMADEIALRRGIRLPPEALAALVDPPPRGCIGFVFGVIWWMVKKVIRTILLLWEFKVVVDTGVRAAHLALLLDHAAVRGQLTPERAPELRKAFDATFGAVEVRWIERKLYGPLRGKARQKPEVLQATPADTEAARLAAELQGITPGVLSWFEQELP